ncbi:MAG: ribbon-helix-helix protein, CopG family [Betaproteobacteria bacterium]|nr:ribbon-helix-helix protein, CopG family [Betaproteobacteria bacterium]
MKSKVTTAQVPQPLLEKVDEIAARRKRSRGWVLTQALTAWIDREEERRRPALEAMADMDAGRANNAAIVRAKMPRLVDGKKSKKEIETPVDEMRASYRREDFAALERGKFHAQALKAQFGASHVTPAGVNIFADLGFPPLEAAMLLEKSDRLIAEKLAVKGKKTPLTRSFRVTVRERIARDPEFARALRTEAAMLKDDSTEEKRPRQTRKVALKK